jgi:hypothetical protein
MKVAQAMVIAILLAGLVSAQAPQKAKEDNVAEILNVVGNLAREWHRLIDLVAQPKIQTR